MSLPKIDLPRYSHYLVGIDKKIKYRPFTTKEQKILLQAKEDGSEEQMLEAILQVIELCTYGSVDAENLPFFDIEDIFIRIRAKSVADIVELKYRVTDANDEPTGEVFDINIDLNKVKVTLTEGHDKKIMITDSIGMVMKYPPMSILSTKDDVQMMKYSIDYIFDKDQIYKGDDFTDKDLNDFIDDFDTKVWAKIKKFFDTMPRIRHNESVTLKDGTIKTIELEGLSDFF
jgi:hypothetical protein